ncbi:MAG: diguanylate cyclase (GGDEF)-like protein/PAS domain S-box-containing protein [Sulfurimonas sp.]
MIEKWFTSPKSAKNIQFNLEQYNYLKNKKVITMCIDPDWLPFEKLEDSKHIGITSDYFKIFQTQLGIPIKVIQTNNWEQSLEFAKNRKCDILSLASQTVDRKKYMNFTNPYIIEPIVLATRPNIAFISDLKQLKKEKLAITKGYAFKEILLERYPNLQIVYVDNITDGLEKVVNGELFGFIDILPSIAYMFQEKFLNELKISGTFIDQSKLSIAVRNDDLLLLNLFNKLINNISTDTKQKISNKYTAIKYEKGFDYSLFWKIFGVVIIILMILVYKNRVIENSNKKIKKYFEVIDKNFLTSSSDLEGKITHVSEALCKTTGYTKDELIGRNHNIFKHPDMDISVYKDLWETILKGDTWIGELKNLNKDGSYYWADYQITPILKKDGSIKGFDAMRHDITDRKRLRELSITDSLTQISNRLYLDDCYARELKRAKRYNNVFSVMIIDIDFFKQVNDEYGHKRGDSVLIQLAQVLKDNIRSLDILGRWGGEEFLIICPETNMKNAQILAEKIRTQIELHDFKIMKHVTCSIGVTQYKHDDEAEDTFKRSDEALYEAKNSGRNKVVIK